MPYLKWLEFEIRCFKIDLLAEEEDKLVAELTGFWELFCRDVLQANSGKPWDHLWITMRGVDGDAGIYQQVVGVEPTIVVWCCVHLPWWESIIYDMPASDDPADLTFENASNEQDERFARLIVEAAQQAGLAKLAGRADSGVRLRFHRYDNRDPFMDVVIH